MAEFKIEEYLRDRVDNQIGYFDNNAMKNKRAYRLLKLTAISCNLLTTTTIALAFTVPPSYKVLMGIVALVLSTVVLATYQLEEFQNFGAKWEKFRLVTEQIKAEKFMFLNNAGVYALGDEQKNQKHLVETVESVIRGTDIAYFSLMVRPGERIEKRLQKGKEPGTEF